MIAPVLDIPDEGFPGDSGSKTDRARGRLRWDDRGRPSVITDEEIRHSHTIRVSTGLNYMSVERDDGPRKMVADSVPVSVLGTLDNGTAITIRGSILMGGPLSRPQAHLRLSLLALAHAPSEDALFSPLPLGESQRSTSSVRMPARRNSVRAPLTASRSGGLSGATAMPNRSRVRPVCTTASSGRSRISQVVTGSNFMNAPIRPAHRSSSARSMPA